MSIVFLLIHVSVNARNDRSDYMKNRLKKITALAEERFQHFVGKNNQPINIQHFTYKATETGTEKVQDYGYFILPYENDARIMQDILKYEFAISSEGQGKKPEDTGVPTLPAVDNKYSADYPAAPTGSGTAN